MKKIIEQTIKKVLQDLKLKAVKFSVEHPENMAWGDYSTNAGIITHQPQAICDRLKAEKTLSKIASKIEVAGAGFINISIQPEALITQTDKLLKDGVTRLRQGFGGQRKIMVEFAHPNTHKEMHIGHMRTLIVGEALARILTAAGARVFRANYQGDIGPHVAKSIWGTQKILAEQSVTLKKVTRWSAQKQAHFLGEGYVRGNQEYGANEKEIDALNAALYA